MAAQASSGCREWRLLSRGCAWGSPWGGFSPCRAQALGHVGSVAAAHRLSCPAVWGIFLDQGSNPCPLHWQVDSYHWATREVSLETWQKIMGDCYWMGGLGQCLWYKEAENRLLRSWAPETESFLISFLEVSSMSQTWMRGKNPGESLVPDIPVGFVFQDPEQLPVVLERKKS